MVNIFIVSFMPKLSWFGQKQQITNAKIHLTAESITEKYIETKTMTLHLALSGLT